MSIDKMNNQDRLEALAEICHLYYNEGKSQIEIAEEYNTTRFKISKYLQDARAENIVTISINSSNNRSSRIEKMLCDKFGLKQAIVLNNQYISHPEALRELGRYGANCLNKYMNASSIIGLMWGKTIESIIDQLPHDKQLPVDFISLTGIVPLSRSNADNFNLLRKAASAYRANYHHIYAPLYSNDEHYIHAWKKEPLNAKIDLLAKNLDIVITGIGGLTSLPTVTPFWEDYVSEKDRFNDSLGSIFGKVLNKDGSIADIPLNEKLIAIDFEDIMNAPTRICLAQGKHKIDALEKALERNYINVLITDMDTALPIVTK